MMVTRTLIKKENLFAKDNIRHIERSVNAKRCSICGSSTTYKDKNKSGVYEFTGVVHPGNLFAEDVIVERIGKSGSYPIAVKCDQCSSMKQLYRNMEHRNGLRIRIEMTDISVGLVIL